MSAIVGELTVHAQRVATDPAAWEALVVSLTLPSMDDATVTAHLRVRVRKKYLVNVHVQFLVF